jgi:hypothetical protein
MADEFGRVQKVTPVTHFQFEILSNTFMWADYSQALWACFHYGLAPLQVVWKIVNGSSRRQPTWTVWLAGVWARSWQPKNQHGTKCENCSIPSSVAEDAVLLENDIAQMRNWVPTVLGDLIAGARNVILLGYFYPWLWGHYVGILKIAIRLPISAVSYPRSTKSSCYSGCQIWARNIKQWTDLVNTVLRFRVA